MFTFPVRLFSALLLITALTLSGCQTAPQKGLTPAQVDTISWLPPTCGYRLVREGSDLYWWHPLVSGDPETVHTAGVSIRGQTISELTLDEPEDALSYEAPEWMVERGTDGSGHR